MLSPEQSKEFYNVFNDCDGFCDSAKITKMSKYIIERDVKRYVEIGVYGGKSLLPNAYVLKCMGGSSIGIDPWNVEDAMQILFDDATTQRINIGTRAIDFEKVYQNVIQTIEKYNLQDSCRLIRKKSADAMQEVGEMDMLYIDGNHGEQAVINDIKNYLPKLKVGGILWFDDVHSTWPTVVNASNYAKQFCNVVEQDGAQLILEKI